MLKKRKFNILQKLKLKTHEAKNQYRTDIRNQSPDLT